MSTDPGLLRTIEEWEIVQGVPVPMGASWVESRHAYNFSLYSRNAISVTLLFYTVDDLVNPTFAYRFDPRFNKSGPIWHCWIPEENLHGATLYGYRVEGPWDPAAGHRFDESKILLDPYATTVWFPPDFSRDACAQPGPTDGKAPLGVLPVRDAPFDWGADLRPRHNHDAIIYELHVKGFTARANSGVAAEKRGTFAALIEKIPYLVDLGVTIVELLPIHQFDPQENNYWGYMTLNFFAPHHAYVSESNGRIDAHHEFRSMVRAFHEAGIEVWLDVVYNHTSETGTNGPTYSLRGIDNSSYYLVDIGSGAFKNDSGCGNTVRCAHPASRALILESLRTWGTMGRVDGFRFDLASILTRTLDGSLPQDDPALISEISARGYRGDVSLVAEAWDVGCYQLGRGFPGSAWRQWNGKFRDDMRAFIRGDGGKVTDLMRRIYGSDDLFPDTLVDSYRPFQSVNFITAHDGFCLYDLTAYNEKHNAANGHDNTDGTNDNLSWNCGWEGDAGAPDEVVALRRKQVRNFFTILMLSAGTPMFCAGDEFLNTQQGNNNPYNQDNETTWLNWDLLEANADVHRFFKTLIAFRKSHPSLGRSTFWREDVHWYGVGPDVDMGSNSHSLALCVHGASHRDDDIYVMINGWWEPLTFAVQEGEASEWRRVVDTDRPSPEDIAAPGEERPLTTLDYTVAPRSVVVLVRKAPAHS